MSNNCGIIIFPTSLLEEKILANISFLYVNKTLSHFFIPLLICNIRFSMICLQKYVSFLISFKFLPYTRFTFLFYVMFLALSVPTWICKMTLKYCTYMLHICWYIKYKKCTLPHKNHVYSLYLLYKSWT